jgi:hypothetical protein
MRKLFLIFSIALTASGCMRGPTTADTHEYYNPAFDPMSCDQLSPDTGGTADLTTISAEDQQNSGFFDKPYNRSELAAVFATSPVETARFANALGITLYKIPRHEQAMPQTPCRLFAFMPLAPWVFLDFWGSISGTGPIRGTLAGLYFENCEERSCDPSRVVSPMILLDDSVDRWTLVHEMTHHNFDRERKKLGVTPNFRLLDAIGVAKVQYETAKAQKQFVVAAQKLDEMSKLTFQVLVQSAFEEIAVEGSLLREYQAGNLHFVHPRLAQNAAWYIEQSRNAGMLRFDYLRNEILSTEALAQIAGNAEALTQVRAVAVFITDVERSTQAMVSDAQMRANQIQQAGPFSQLVSGSVRAQVNSENRSGITAHITSHNPELKKLDQIFH